MARRRDALSGTTALWYPLPPSLLHADDAPRDSRGGKVPVSPEKLVENGPSKVELEGAPSTATPAKPNVFFIMVDDMGWNDIGYQSTDMTKMTPNLDRLAASGVKVRKGKAALYSQRDSQWCARESVQSLQFHSPNPLKWIYLNSKLLTESCRAVWYVEALSPTGTVWVIS